MKSKLDHYPEPLFLVGDILTLDNQPGVPPEMKWRVDAIVPGKGVRLRPADDTNVARFNDACGEYWITGPGDRPFD